MIFTLKDVRLIRGMTQAELASKVNVNAPDIIKWEKDEYMNTSVLKTMKVMEVLKTPLTIHLGQDENGWPVVGVKVSPQMGHDWNVRLKEVGGG